MRVRVAVTVVLLLVGSATAARPQPAPAERRSLELVQYTLSFPAPSTHYVEVEAVIPTERRPQIELMMPVWTPGSYLIREHSRHVEAVRATRPDGRQLTVEKTAKNRWRVETGGEGSVAIAYRVYARQMSVRTNWVDAQFALINGAATFLTPVDGLTRPHHVRVRLPAAWTTAISGMPSGDGPHSFVADDFDALVDSPIVAGNPAVHTFVVNGRPHLLVNVLDDGSWNAARSTADVGQIIKYYAGLMGGLPYDRYVIFNLLTGTGGGLEHRNSTVLMASRGATKSRTRYRSWLSLVSHEFFHVWNVKRLRPAELGPFDYEAENYTRSLWVAEGLTEYYGDLALRRAGLTTDEEYLAELSRLIATLQTSPGRQTSSVEAASFDAWIRQYRPDENSPNVTISYYTKGAVVGFILDAAVRRATGDRRSLDDVMRLAYERFSGARGFTPAEFRQAVNDVAGVDLSDQMRRLLETTAEIDYSEALGWFGLEFATRPTATFGPLSWQGLNLRQDGDRLVVSQLLRDTPAYGSGINVGDQILGLNDRRVSPDQWIGVVSALRVGDTVSVLVARRGEQMRFDVRIDPPGVNPWHLQRAPTARPEQRERLRRWLAGS